MAEAKYVFDSKSINKISEEFINSRKELSEVTVEVDNINNIDPLTIIRVVNSGTSPDVKELCTIAELLFDGSTITFRHKDTVIKSIVYARGEGKGNRLSLVLSTESYLLDKLLDVTYAILLKKSTPQ